MGSNTSLVRFKLPDGTDAVFESVLESDGSEELVSRKDGDIPEATERLEYLAKKIQPVAQTLFSALEEFNTPDEIDLEFGIKLGGRAGIVFASAESGCNFKIALKWLNPKHTSKHTG